VSTAGENWIWIWLTLRESPAVLLEGPATTASRARPRVVTSEYSPGRSSADERSATHSRKVRQNQFSRGSTQSRLLPVLAVERTLRAV
jgi:hypothetical protein